MRRTLLKIIGTIFIVLIVSNIFIANINTSRALSDVTLNPDIWVSGDDDVGESELNSKARPILSIIRVVGIVVSVLTLAIIALKIMFASVEEKASYKQTLMPWMVGAVMLFAMTTIPGIIYDVMQGESSTHGKVETSTEKVIVEVRCVNGNKVKYVEASRTGWYECQTYNCGCESKTKLIYMCPGCKKELSDFNSKWYCGECGNLYNK